MNDIVINDADQATESERTTLTIAYVLHVVGPFTAFLLNLAGLILNHIKAAETQNHYIRSHHVWMLRTFWWTLLWLVISSPLWFLLVFPGAIAYTIIGIWYLYRCLSGWLRFNDNRFPQ